MKNIICLFLLLSLIFSQGEGGENVDILGYSAAAIASLIFWPQAYKTIKSKDVDSLSIYSILLQLTANVMWFSYGMLKQDYPIVIVQVSILTANLIILMCYIKWNFPKPANSVIDKKEV